MQKGEKTFDGSEFFCSVLDAFKLNFFDFLIIIKVTFIFRGTILFKTVTKL